MTVLTILLFVEYRFFKKQAQQMIMLKEDYQNHLLAVNRVLDEYNKTKEKLEHAEALLEQKKKYERVVPANLFASNARVFSSDDIPEKDHFVIVNRDLEHLKHASIAFLKKQKFDGALQKTAQSFWRDYTDQALEKTQEEKNKTKTKRNKRRKIIAQHKKKRVEQLSSAVRESVRKERGYTDITFSWPIRQSDFWLSSFFGPRKRANGAPGFHYGVDMAAVRGTLVYPAADGVVVEAGYVQGYGKKIVVAHGRKYKTCYAHLDKILVKPGRNVSKNDVIGHVGSTGYVRSKNGKGGGSHLHFEVSVFGKKVNPMYFLA